MLIRYVLRIGEDNYTLREDDLRNWDEIKMSYKREAIDGVVRSFSSQFEFVNMARRYLLDEYLENGVNAEATITIFHWTDKWTWEKGFSCPLDFSTIEFDEVSLRLNAVDNSLAALIKANKSTKYEFVVGEDISKGRKLVFDRLPMCESATYKFTQGISYEDSPNILVSFKGDIPWVGNVGSEIVVNRCIHFLDDQEDKDTGYILKAYADTVVNFDFSLTYLRDGGNYSTSVNLSLRIRRNGSFIGMGYGAGGQFAQLLNDKRRYRPGTDLASVPTISEIKASMGDDLTGVIAVVNGIVYEASYAPWLSDNWQLLSTLKTPEEYLAKNVNGSMTLSLKEGDEVVVTSSGTDCSIMFTDSTMVFGWNATGETIEIDTILPKVALSALVYKMTGRDDVPVSINTTTLINNTYLLAAESIRGLQGAKFYSSFSEFCDWMETVFGYVYVIETDDTGKEGIRFLHRTKLFSADAAVRKIEHCDEIKYSIDSGLLYSAVTVGYDKKDYGSVNGRDEFNFNNTYSTGCTVSDKTLSLLSKYRADCYGIEFAAQKRNADTTDSSTDQDVFFFEGISVNGVLSPARKHRIEGTLSDKVFNGSFSPLECVKANEGYIGMQSQRLNLTFASSTGKIDVVIDGARMDANITLNTQLATAGILQFTTDDVEDITDAGEIVEITDMDGIRYRGYIKEVDLKYARTEAATYKLIVKEIKS